MRKWIALLALIITSSFFLKFSNSGSAMLPSPLPARQAISLDPETASLVSAFDAYFTNAMLENGSPGAAVVIVHNDKVVFCQGYGVRSAHSPVPVDEHTVFRIGSLSKGFAAVLTGMLVEDSTLAWNDKVVAYFPAFRLRDAAQTKRIELTHLLSHTTGLPYHAYTNLVEKGLTVTEIASQYFPQVPLNAKEGILYSYQNAAFSCIEEVIRAASGKSYQDNLREKIFEPAGMKTASSAYADIMAQDDRATPHHNTKYGWQEEKISNSYYNTAAAGGVNASISDMGQWLLLLMGQKPGLIADSTLNTIYRPRVRTENERRAFRHWEGPKEAWYGLGFRTLVQGSDTLVYHAGYVNGFKGEIALDRKRHYGICVLFNGAAPLSGDCIPEFFNLVRD
ncbi:MAG: beta-lactamase family protein [Lewinellaceae bacterium]|nr:beta-lactamase family protein [Lewinellaceae bacterium]